MWNTSWTPAATVTCLPSSAAPSSIRDYCSHRNRDDDPVGTGFVGLAASGAAYRVTTVAVQAVSVVSVVVTDGFP